MPAPTYAVTGASGLIGSALVAALQRDGLPVLRLVRREPTRADEVRWDPASGSVDTDALAGVTAVVHLAGAGVAERPWTAGYRRTVLESRTSGTRTIAAAVARLDPQPALVSGSAIGLYGDAGDTVLDEGSPAGTGFLAEVVTAWEAATAPAAEAGVRVCSARTGLVVSRRGGAFGRLLPTARAGLLPRFGDGQQWWSLISLEDEVRALRWLADTGTANGAYDLTAAPTRQEEVVRLLGEVHRRVATVPVPKVALRAVGEVSRVLLDSQRVEPRRLREEGFVFSHPTARAILETTR
ncbi:hypothetical protein EV189_1353 [Motilibacter rhizosphaerae]|uniref:TIGR01777 family protein n=1 Tax=Motilibacter rhizosphaerae TaxID=598652 RepID=A0A4Q7NR94_9ACTN|nr:TIGR01777 family oxidoreductase [Motilibacter rhizosphaerae]RZS89586.1 hypothetical protein EV189_1353 [Motilibacter rhizosphaerae]